MTGKQMIDEYKKAGWIIDRIRGSHYLLRKVVNGVTYTETIPYGKRDLKKGLEKALLKRLKEVGI